MSEQTWTFAQTFYASFQSSTSDLEHRIESATKSQSQDELLLQSFTTNLAKLAKNLADATGSLPSYDQRQCELQLKTLEKKLEVFRAFTMPKSKFSFKRKANSNSNYPPPQSTSTVPPTPIDMPLEGLPIPNTPNANSSPSTHVTLTSQSHQYLTLNTLLAKLSATHRSHSDLTISNLDKCIVNLLPSPSSAPQQDKDDSSKDHLSTSINISALHIRNITDTILILPIIQGSVILHDLKRCVVVVGCHQFRMHTSQNVDVYLSIPSNPIIEHSSVIRFAAYPTSLYPREKPISISNNNYTSVQDFSHIRPTQSPNWCIMPDGVRVHNWFEGLGPKEDRTILKLLDELLPPLS